MTDRRRDEPLRSLIGVGHFVGLRWAEWTAGGRVPDDVVDDMLEVLARGLPPRKRHEEEEAAG